MSVVVSVTRRRSVPQGAQDRGPGSPRSRRSRSGSSSSSVARSDCPGSARARCPASMVRKRFRQEIEQEMVERLVPRYWKQAQAEKSLEPLLHAPDRGTSSLNDGEPLVFTATVEVRPEIELSEDREYDLPDVDVDVHRRSRSTRRSSSCGTMVATWVPVERELRRGDQVAVQIRRARRRCRRRRSRRGRERA